MPNKPPNFKVSLHIHKWANVESTELAYLFHIAKIQLVFIFISNL